MSKNKQTINNPLQLIEEGLKNQNWQHVSDGYFQLCGKRIKVTEATQNGQYDDLLGLLVTRYAKVNNIALGESTEVDSDEDENLDRPPTPIPVEEEEEPVEEVNPKKRGRPSKESSSKITVRKKDFKEDVKNKSLDNLEEKFLDNTEFNTPMRVVNYDKFNSDTLKANAKSQIDRDIKGTRNPVKSEMKCTHCGKNFIKKVALMKTSMEDGMRHYKCSFCKEKMQVK